MIQPSGLSSITIWMEIVFTPGINLISEFTDGSDYIFWMSNIKDFPVSNVIGQS